MKDEEMNITISGGRLPIVGFAVGITFILATIFYATIWITKLDDRVLTNTIHISEMRKEATTQAKIMTILQSNCSKQTFVLDTMIKRVEKLEDAK